MPVTNAKELTRTFENELGKVPKAVRRWVCVLSDQTLSGSPVITTEILNATTGQAWGVPHPDNSACKLRRVEITEGYEGSPYHVLVTAEFSIVRDEELVAPADRPAVWSFEGQGIEVPALYYYSGGGNGTMYPLTNSAGDYFPNLTTSEFAIRARVTKNFTALPSAQLQATNSVNSDGYLGGGPHTWKCAGVAINYVYEEWSGVVIKYWQAVSELMYRYTGWDLQLPDVGWNFIDGGQRRRAMVFDFNNGDWVASATPVGLNGSGGMTLGAPAILVRRVAPELAFTPLFGEPPT